MATTTSPDGLPAPTGTDQVTPLETWFANLVSKLQTALTSIRTDVSKVHDVTEVPLSDFGAVAAGCTMNLFEARRTGALVSGSMKIDRAAGFVHGQTIFTVKEGFRPATAWKFTLPATGGGGGAGASTLSCNVDGAGVVALFSPNGRTTAEISFTWVVAP